MSLTVTQRPSITEAGDTSAWNAVANPILYKMQRKDFTFNQVNNNGGFVQLQFTGVDITGSFSNGASLYVSSDNDVYDSVATQTAEAFSGGNTLITTDIPYTAVAPGGFVNNETLRPSYRVRIRVFGAAELADLTFSPTSKGFLSIDISAVLKSNLSPEIPHDLTGTTELFDDTGAYIQFYIKYTEQWTGSAESETNDNANLFYGSISARQILSEFGGNMFEYVPVDGDPLSLFLTKMNRPVMWRGYPFLIGLITCADAGNVYLQTDAADATTPASYPNKILLFDLNQLLASQTPDEVELEFFLEDSPSDIQLSETKTIELRDACINPVMLMARNSLGGIIQWMFEGNQEQSVDFGNQAQSKRQVLVADNLTLNQWMALHDFFGLGDVYRDVITELTSSITKTHSRIGQQVYVLDEDGNKTGVIVIPTRNRTNTNQALHRFEIEIEYPQYFAP